MHTRKGNFILFGMVTGAILGVMGGYFLSDIMVHIKFLGTIFLNALKMIVVPLIIASLIIGVTSLGDIRRLGRTAGKTLLYYIATTSFSVLIGIILVNLIHPGTGVPPIGAGVPEFVGGSGQNTVIDVIVGLVPDNIFGAAAEGQILPLIIFALIFGGVLTAIGAKGRPVIGFFDGVNAAIMKIVTLIIYFAPIGILALIGGIVAENRESVHELVTALGIYAVTVIAGLIIHATIILPLILKLLGKKSPFDYFLNMGQALATAFTTASSSATLPVTMESVEEKNKVDSRAASFVLPLGATINMDGTALYEAVAAVFIAQIYGIDLSIGAQVVIFFTATLASIGAAAIPEAGLVMMSLVLTAVGLPLEGIGIILAIDWFLDRCRTTVNVWGDSVGAAVIGETSEIKSYSRPMPRVKPAGAGEPDSRKARPEPEKSARGGQAGERSRPAKPRSGHKKDWRQRGSRKPKARKETGTSRRGNHHPGKERTGRRFAAGEQYEESPKARIERDKAPAARGQGETFFDKEFSKMDIFTDMSTGKDTGTRETEESRQDTGEKTEETYSEKEREKEVGAASKKKAKEPREDEKEEEEDMWGRIRRKRPAK